MAPDAKLCSSCSERLFGSPAWLGTISDRNLGSRVWTCTFCLEENPNKTPRGGEHAVKVLISHAALFCADFFQASGRCFFSAASCITSVIAKSSFSLGLYSFLPPTIWSFISLFLVMCFLPHPCCFCRFSEQLKELSCG